MTNNHNFSSLPFNTFQHVHCTSPSSQHPYRKIGKFYFLNISFVMFLFSIVSKSISVRDLYIAIKKLHDLQSCNIFYYSLFCLHHSFLSPPYCMLFYLWILFIYQIENSFPVWKKMKNKIKKNRKYPKLPFTKHLQKIYKIQNSIINLL